MALDIDALEPHIVAILSAPGTDLTTISAKRVRKQLQQIDPSLTPSLLKEHRDAVDAVIARVFERVQGANGSQDDSEAEEEEEEPVPVTASRKRRQSEDDEDVPEEETDDNPSPAKKSKKAVQRELTDAELARQLSSEINGRTRRSSTKSKAAPKNASASKKKSKAKSAEMIDTDEDSDSPQGKRPAKKKRSSEGGAAKGGFAKLYILSEPLAALLGVDRLSRPQVVKQLWAYIKSNELQNPNNGREIICDPRLRPVFNVDKIDMFKMNKVLGQHLHDIE